MVRGKTDEEIGLMAFTQFAYCDALDLAEKQRIVKEAIALGCDRAAEIEQEYGLPKEIFHSVGIKIEDEKERNDSQKNYVKFAEYHVKTGKVYLNRAAIKKIDQELEPGQAERIVLCHELYHFFEAKRWGSTAGLFVRDVKLFGWIPTKRKILPAAEIAANSFTKQYLNLEFNPQIIEDYYFDKN